MDFTSLGFCKAQRYWRRSIRNATELAYLQIQLGGEVHFEGPAESCLWRTPDKNFQYLIRHCMFSIDTDLQNFGLKEYDRKTPRKRDTTILTTDDHFRKTFRKPKMNDHSNLSLEEDKSDWQYWIPHYPQDFCEEILLSFTSHIDKQVKTAQEFLDQWPKNWKASKDNFSKQSEYRICQHCGNETCHFANTVVKIVILLSQSYNKTFQMTTMVTLNNDRRIDS